MLFIKSHRVQIQPDGYEASIKSGRPVMSMKGACGFYADEPYPDKPGVPFDYLFPDAPVPHHGADTTAELDTLADSMLDEAQAGEDNTDVPAIITYLGQFIDHDITAGTDRAVGFSDVDIEDVEPLDRDDVRTTLANLRTGALDLDSVYGGAAEQGGFAAEMTGRLRHPIHRDKLRIGTDREISGFGARPERPFPADEDPAHDLLRAERLIRDEDGVISDGMAKGLPADLQAFLTDDGKGAPNPARAVIGDGRNDENLAVATVHLAVARLHNRFVDHAPEGSADQRYAWARERVRWTYQWLLTHVYLPSICDAAMLAEVVEQDAPVYKGFLQGQAPAAGQMPIPLEFSVAAFRFGHSTARADYDWNANFGRADAGQPSQKSRATFRDFFAFTGSGEMAGTGDRLPSNWLVDVAHFINDGKTAHPDRNTRLIDTHLAEPLHDMNNEEAGKHGVLKVLPRRNLRRSQRLALPSAQGCLQSLARMGVHLPILSEEQLRSGQSKDALSDALLKETPLWFYVLKEAEVLHKGMRLGPLGTRIIAETLVGLVWHGPDTYRDQPGSDGGVWHPRDGVMPAGEPVDSLPALMRAAAMA